MALTQNFSRSSSLFMSPKFTRVGLKIKIRLMQKRGGKARKNDGTFEMKLKNSTLTKLFHFKLRLEMKSTLIN